MTTTRTCFLGATTSSLGIGLRYPVLNAAMWTGVAGGGWMRGEMAMPARTPAAAKPLPGWRGASSWMAPPGAAMMTSGLPSPLRSADIGEGRCWGVSNKPPWPSNW